MASNTVTITAVGQTPFDFNTTRRGNVFMFCNDLNIVWGVNAQAPGVLQRLHTGPILFVVSFMMAAGVRITATATAINSGFPPPPLSFLQLQTDTVNQL